MTCTIILDVEMRPALCWVWQLDTRYIPPQQIKEPKRLLCCAWKELGKPDVQFTSEWDDGREGMARILHGVLDSADIIVGHNSVKFDVPIILTEIMLAGLDPPSPFQQVDTLKAARRFSFMSNRLGEVAKMLDTPRKLENSGFDMFLRVMEGDESARQEIRTYNVGDILATEAIFLRLRPWIKGPNVAILNGSERACPTCGSPRLIYRGYSATSASAYRRLQCRDCKAWSREAKREATTDLRQAA